jgi:Fic family protein
MLEFANETESDIFIHPVVRAIILHFWLAYEHPFVDGNGRTARALFYWSMLRQGYWLFEYISISRVLKKAPVKYGRSFLETETDDDDLTYFINYQLEVIGHSLQDLEGYLERKMNQVHETEKLLKQTNLNHREIALISHAIRHPGQEYLVKSHQTSHRIAYATARADLIHLAEIKLLEQRRIGAKTLAFIAPGDIEKIIREIH